MDTLQYRIDRAIDLESISDALAGVDAAVVVTPEATIRLEFWQSISEATHQRIDQIMIGLGASPDSI